MVGEYPGCTGSSLNVRIQQILDGIAILFRIKVAYEYVEGECLAQSCGGSVQVQSIRSNPALSYSPGM
jgi:hypothetical protein